MNRTTGVILLVLSAVLLIVGLNLSNSLNSELSLTMESGAGDSALWCLTAAAAVAAFGLFFTFSES